MTWEASIDDLAPQQFIRYDLYVNSLPNRRGRHDLSGGRGDCNQTSTITVIAVDTADRESTPASIIVVN